MRIMSNAWAVFGVRTWVVRYHGSTLIFETVRKERMKQTKSAFSPDPVFTIHQSSLPTSFPSLKIPYHLFGFEKEVL